jgi:hypothetical protein
MSRLNEKPWQASACHSLIVTEYQSSRTNAARLRVRVHTRRRRRFIPPLPTPAWGPVLVLHAHCPAVGDFAPVQAGGDASGRRRRGGTASWLEAHERRSPGLHGIAWRRLRDLRQCKKFSDVALRDQTPI